MKYRDHKGSLSDSMDTVIDVNSPSEIISHLNKFYNQFGKEVDDIKFEYCGFDDRIGWDTYYVSARLKGSEEYRINGMTDGTFS